MIDSVMFFDLSPHTLGSYSPISLAFLSLLINFHSINVICMLMSLQEKTPKQEILIPETRDTTLVWPVCIFLALVVHASLLGMHPPTKATFNGQLHGMEKEMLFLISKTLCF